MKGLQSSTIVTRELKRRVAVIQYFPPGQQNPTADKQPWDFGSKVVGFRHARLVVIETDKPFITSEAQGTVFDAAKDNKSRLVPICEEFRAAPRSRFLYLGIVKACMDNAAIKGLVENHIKEEPEYHLLNNNCEILAEKVGSQIIEGPYPMVVKMRGDSQAVQLGAVSESLQKIAARASFNDAVFYDPDNVLNKGPGPVKILDIPDEKK